MPQAAAGPPGRIYSLSPPPLSCGCWPRPSKGPPHILKIFKNWIFFFQKSKNRAGASDTRRRACCSWARARRSSPSCGASPRARASGTRWSRMPTATAPSRCPRQGPRYDRPSYIIMPSTATLPQELPQELRRSFRTRRRGGASWDRAARQVERAGRSAGREGGWRSWAAGRVRRPGQGELGPRWEADRARLLGQHDAQLGRSSMLAVARRAAASAGYVSSLS